MIGGDVGPSGLVASGFRLTATRLARLSTFGRGPGGERRVSGSLPQKPTWAVSFTHPAGIGWTVLSRSAR